MSNVDFIMHKNVHVHVHIKSTDSRNTIVSQPLRGSFAAQIIRERSFRGGGAGGVPDHDSQRKKHLFTFHVENKLNSQFTWN